MDCCSPLPAQLQRPHAGTPARRRRRRPPRHYHGRGGLRIHPLVPIQLRSGNLYATVKDASWDRYLQDSSQCWSYRSSKENVTYQEFIPNITKHKLQIIGSLNRTWVVEEVEYREALPHEGLTAWQRNDVGAASVTESCEISIKLVQNGQLHEAAWTVNCMQKDGLPVPVYIFHHLLAGSIKQKNLALAREVHSLIKNSECKLSVSITRKMIRMYAFCGSLIDANQVFLEAFEPDVSVWTAIISVHVRFGEYEKAILLYDEMKCMGVKPDAYVHVAVLQACTRATALSHGESIHADSIEYGFDQSVLVGNSLINMYAKCNRFENSNILFNRMAIKDVTTWNIIIGSMFGQCCYETILDLFCEMRNESIEPNSITLLCGLKACTSMRSPSRGFLMHGLAIELGLEPDVFVASTALDMYAKCGDVESAKILFCRIHNRDLAVWNVLITLYSRNGYSHEAVSLLQLMYQEGIEPDKVTWTALITGHVRDGHSEASMQLLKHMQEKNVELDNVMFVSVLQACSSSSNIALGLLIHGLILSMGCKQDAVIGCTLINMYCKCGSLENAGIVFNEWPVRNVAAWNAMVAGYAQSGRIEEALQLFGEMQENEIQPDIVTWNIVIASCAKLGQVEKAMFFLEKMKTSGLNPDQRTFSSVLEACSTTLCIELGRMIHMQITLCSTDSDIVLNNIVINMYARCGYLIDAQWMFKSVKQRDVVTWTTLISGYMQNDEYAHKSIELFIKMQLDGIEPNEHTFVCAVKACSCVPCLRMGRHVHAQIVEISNVSLTMIGNSLINMYIKCGVLDDALEVFNCISYPDVVTWTSIIAGLVQHGNSEGALLFYKQMLDHAVKPDSCTYVQVLKACSNLRLLDKGKDVHTIISNMGYPDHMYATNSLIDMYANCGSLKDAATLFLNSPKEDLVAWNSMITAYVENDQSEDAVLLLYEMSHAKMKLDHVTYIGVLKACAKLVSVDLGRLLHSLAIEDGLEEDELVLVALINMYAKCWKLADAQLILDRSSKFGPSPWTAMIGALAHHSAHELAISCFQEMRDLGVEPDAATFTSLLSVFGHVGFVADGFFYFQLMQTHYAIVPQLEHFNCLIDLLGRAGCFEEAEDLLEIVPFKRNSIGFISLLTHCRSYSKTDIGKRYFDYVSLIEPENAIASAAYVLMSQTYAGERMWMDAECIEDTRISKEIWKKSGKAVIEIDGQFYTFLARDKNHAGLPAVQKRLKQLYQQCHEAGLVPCVRPGGFGFDTNEDSSTAHCEQLAIAFGLNNTPKGGTLRISKNLRVCTNCHDAIKLISKVEKRDIILSDSYRNHYFKDGVCSCKDFF